MALGPEGFSGCGSWSLGHRLSCPEACGILVPRPGIEPVSPASAGKFLTTGPPGKFSNKVLNAQPSIVNYRHNIVELSL